MKAAYHLDSGSGSTAVDNAYGFGTFRGIKKGVDTSNLNFHPDQWGGGGNTGELDITCPGGDSECQFTRGGTTYSGAATGAINYGIATDGQSKGTRYVMYSETSVHSRFTSPDPHNSNADHFIAVHYEGGQWQYDPNDNSGDYAFTPRESDILVAEFNGKASDDSGNEGSIRYVTPMDGYDGTLNGPTWSSGKYNGALSFDGTDDYIETTNPVNPTQQSESLTISFWLNPNSGTGTNALVEWDSGAHVWQYNSEDDFFFNPNGDCSSVEATGEIIMDSWNHYAVQYDRSASEFRWYVNGNQVQTSSQTCSPETSTSPFRIGRRTGDDRVLDGEIDEIRIYDRALSQTEILNLYKGGGSKTGSPTGSFWIEDGSIRWIDSFGYERAYTASDTGNNVGNAGNTWIENGDIHYIDANGNERVVN